MTLSATQWVVAAIGFAVMTLLAFGMTRTRAGITWRRSITLVMAAGVFSWAIWLLGGGTIGWPGRHVTFIASCHSDPELVSRATQRLSPESSGHTLLLFYSEARPCPTVSGRLLREPVGRVVATRASEAKELLQAARETAAAGLLSALRRLVATETIVFLHDRSLAEWDQIGSVSRRVNLATMEAFSGEIFIADLNPPDAGFSTSFSVGPGLQQGQGFWRQDVVVDLSVEGGPVAPTGVPNSLSVDICLSRNRAASFDDCHETGPSDAPLTDRLLLENVTLSRQAGPLPRWRWFPQSDRPDRPDTPTLGLLVGGFNADRRAGLGAATVSPGWQFIEARVRLRSGAYAGLELAAATEYFEAGQPGPMLMLGRPELADRAWPRPAADPVRTLMRQTWGAEDSRRLQALPSVPQLPPSPGGPAECVLQANASREQVRACAELAGALVLLEPTSDQIDLLSELDLPRQLARRGIPTVVVAPPLRTARAAAWMPAWATPVPGEMRRSLTHVTRSIVLIADCSGLAHMPLDNDVASMMNVAALRPADIQRAVIDLFAAALATIPGAAALPVEQRDGRDLVLRLESRTAWHPATEVQVSPGCLRASDQALPTARALVETAGVAERIDALLGDVNRSAAPFPAFEPGALYPGSAIVVFSTAAAQLSTGGLATRRVGGAALAGHLPVEHTTRSVDDSVLRRLRDAGIRVLLVQLPTSELFGIAAGTAARASGEQTWEEAVGAWQAARLVEVLPVQRGQPDTDIAAALVAALGLSPPAAAPAMATTVLRGRSLDPRMPLEVMAAPSVLIGLQPEPESEVLIRGESGSAIGPVPLAVARYDFGAPVIALAWQPFDPVAWASDDLAEERVPNAMAAACSRECQLTRWIEGFGRLPRRPRDGQSSGLGIQRLIDAIDHNAHRGRPPNDLELVEIRLTPTQDAADFAFRIPAGATSWPEPRLAIDTPKDHCGGRADNGNCPLQLIAIDPSRAEAVYRFSTTSPNGLAERGDPRRAGFFDLLSGSDAANRVNVPLRLVMRESLTDGGAPFENLARAAGALAPEGALPAARRSAATAVIFGLLFSILTLYSPAVRPWHAFSRFRRRRQRQLTPLRFDTEVVSDRIGHQLQRTEASRRSGDPAWMRPFQAGDSLSRARAADLLGLTSLGTALGVPPKRPRMRLREIGESFEVVIGIDDSPALLNPGNFEGLSRKRAAIEALVAVVGAAVQQRGGRWSAVGLRCFGRIERMTSRDPEAVSELLAEFFDPANGRLPVRLSRGLPGATARLLISDFLSLSVQQYVEWIGSGGGAILIRDDAQADELGLGYDATTGAVYDRTIWDQRDAAILLHQLRLEVRHAVEQAGGFFAEVNVDDSDADVAEALMASGVLGLARR